MSSEAVFIQGFIFLVKSVYLHQVDNPLRCPNPYISAIGIDNNLNAMFTCQNFFFLAKYQDVILCQPDNKNPAITFSTIQFICRMQS